MAKLEELSELLVSEIEQFEKTVEKLQKIQEQKIGIDSRTLELLFKDHHENVKDMLEDHSREMKNFGKGLIKAKAYLIWALVIFLIIIIVGFSCLLLLISKPV